MNEKITAESVLNQLYETIISRKNTDPNNSYVAKLFKQGDAKIAQKIGEEGVELAIAIVSQDGENIVKESADSLFFKLVGLAKKGIPFDAVIDELKKREGISGLDEKKSRGTVSKKELEEGTTIRMNFDKVRVGVVPAIAQDATTKQVLMQAWMNEEAFNKTLETRIATYWSTSRKELWVKGSTSGQTQKVVDIITDCDQDSVLLMVDQKGGGACHTGKGSCFYRSEKNGEWSFGMKPL